MLTNLLLNSSSKLKDILALGDSLARSLRENVELFSIDDNQITFLTETGYLINGIKAGNQLTDISVQSSEIFENKSTFDAFVQSKVGELVQDIYHDDFANAKGTFDKVLGLWESQLSYNHTVQKLLNKVEKFSPFNSIMETEEMTKLIELTPQLVKFLKEGKDKISKIPEIRNGVSLVKIISESFNQPRVTYEELLNEGTYTVPAAFNKSLYEYICAQELVRKDLLENKENFENLWASDKTIANLAKTIGSTNSDEIEEAVAKAIVANPYFAIATKKQLHTTLQRTANLNEAKVTNDELSAFVSLVYEMKKPVRKELLDKLNEKYGINVYTLTETPTFANLIKAESVIFEALARLSPKNSVIKEALDNVVEMLKNKTGIESIDVADYLHELFSTSEIPLAENLGLSNYMDFNRIASDVMQIAQILMMLKQSGAGMQPQAGAGMAPQAGGQVPPQAGGQVPPQAGGQMQAPVPQAGGQRLDPTVPNGGPDPQLQYQNDEALNKPQMSPTAAAMAAKQEMNPQQEAPMVAQQDNSMDTMAQLQDLVSDLQAALGGQAGAGMTPQAPQGDVPPGGDPTQQVPGEEMPAEEGGDETESEFGGEQEPDEEEAPPPKKKKKDSKKKPKE